MPLVTLTSDDFDQRFMEVHLGIDLSAYLVSISGNANRFGAICHKFGAVHFVSDTWF